MEKRLSVDELTFPALLLRHPETRTVGFTLLLKDPALTPQELKLVEEGIEAQWKEDLEFLDAVKGLPQNSNEFALVLRRYRQIAEESIEYEEKRDELLGDASLPLSKRIEAVKRLPHKEHEAIAYPGVFQFVYEKAEREMALKTLARQSLTESVLPDLFASSCPKLKNSASTITLRVMSKDIRHPRVKATYHVEAKRVEESGLLRLDEPFSVFTFFDAEKIPVLIVDLAQQDYYEDGEWLSLEGLLSN